MSGGFRAVFAGVLLATVAVASALPAPGPLPAPAVDPGTFAALAADPESAPAFGGALAAAASDPSPLRVLQAMLRADGIDVAPLAVAPGPAPAGAPPELAVPLARLLAAAEAAERLRAEAVAALTPEEQALVLEHGLYIPTPAPAFEPLAPAGGVAQSAGPSAGAWVLHPDVAAMAERVDVPKLAVAALTLLAAAEASTPELRAAQARGSPGVDSHCGMTGTVQFETPNCAVIVGGSGSNTYLTADPIVLVDMGGSDVYSNGAAVAKSGVRLVLDMGGDDVYSQAKTGSGPGAGATTEGQAVSSIGVAVLVDQGGNDRYTASSVTTAPQPGGVAGTARVVAQGVASIGASVLVDQAGRDTFTASASSSGGAAQVVAQGQAGIGVGAVLNLGLESGADDTYSATATSTLHLVSQTPTLSQYSIGPADVRAQAAAELAGVATLTDASGNDAYTAVPRGGTATLFAQGTGQGGAGLLVDAQGDDRMTAQSIGNTTLTLIVNNGSNNTCWTVTVTVSTGETRATGQGATGLGAGALVDGTGNDVRLLEASSHAGAIGGVNTSINCGSFGLTNTVTSTATSGPGTAIGQGQGASGVGAVVDAVGNDVTTIRGASSALASAVVNGLSKVETATATSGAGQALGQGLATTGVGLIADVLGNDAYASSASSTATRTTSAGTTPGTSGAMAQLIQGSGTGNGAGWLLDLDGSDSYTSSPPMTMGANNKCWTNPGGPNGRGRDLQLGSLLPAGCP